METLHYSYEYNLDGNQSKKIEYTGKAIRYYYDGLGRLTQESETMGNDSVMRV